MRGQAMVETAIASLAFIGLIVGLIEVGRGVWNYNMLAHATREGARYAIVHGADSTDPSGPGSDHFTAPDQDEMVFETVGRFGRGLDPDGLAVTSEWPDGDNQRGSKVKVTARYEFHSIFSFLGISPVTLTGSSIMTIQH
jgi:Flp pilus assembly protein TadG